MIPPFPRQNPWYGLNILIHFSAEKSNVNTLDSKNKQWLAVPKTDQALFIFTPLHMLFSLPSFLYLTKLWLKAQLRHYLLSRYLCFLHSVSTYLPYLSILHIYLTEKFSYYIKITSLPKNAVNCCKLGRLVNDIGCCRNSLIVLW